MFNTLSLKQDIVVVAFSNIFWSYVSFPGLMVRTALLLSTVSYHFGLLFCGCRCVESQIDRG